MKKNKKLGFSLAEVLVSLVIIGVVAMLVIPNLLDSSTGKVNETAAAKAKYDISQASLRLQAECPRFRCRTDADADKQPRNRLKNLLPDTLSDGTVQYGVTALGAGNSMIVVVDIDGDGTNDIAYTVNSTGGVLDIDNCTLEKYKDGSGCTNEDVKDLKIHANKTAE